MKPINGVRVFSATMAAERERLGDRVTDWLKANQRIRIDSACVRQSSDEAFHCLSIVVFYWEEI